MTKQAQGTVGCLGMLEHTVPSGSQLLCRLQLAVWKHAQCSNSFKFAPLKFPVPGATMPLESLQHIPLYFRSCIILRLHSNRAWMYVLRQSFSTWQPSTVKAQSTLLLEALSLNSLRILSMYTDAETPTVLTAPLSSLRSHENSLKPVTHHLCCACFSAPCLPGMFPRMLHI